jgi:hypothetical protein
MMHFIVFGMEENVFSWRDRISLLSYQKQITLYKIKHRILKREIPFRRSKNATETHASFHVLSLFPLPHHNR